MEPFEFYTSRVEELNIHLAKLQKRKSYFGWFRFGSIAAFFLAFYILWSLGIAYVIIVSVILLAVFAKLLLADFKNKTAIEHTLRLIIINKDELRFLHGEFDQFFNGDRFAENNHLYANDLDIFGISSLYQFLNRTTSETGEIKLAEYLSEPATINIIDQRQSSIKELSKKIKWIQDLIAKGKENKLTVSTKKRLDNWISEPTSFLQFKPWQWLRFILPVIILTIVGLYIFDVIPQGILYFSLFIFAAIAYQINKYVAPIHEKLSKIAEETDTLSQSILQIEKENFTSGLLKDLQAVFITQTKSASSEITTLKKLLDRLDLRYNLVLSAPLNILLLWNLQQVLDLEKWKKNKQESIDAWFAALAEFECLNSLGILHFNQPDWAFPKVVSDYFILEGKQIGHPIIPKDARVENDILIKNESEIMLVTGSNMAGKSTYLRSIGVNVVLAMAGAPVCAEQLKLSHVQIVTSMRITDNLAESTSTFYAELKKLKTIIEKVNNGERIFILLDEILRGTNSLDRHTGSVALIKQLIKHHAPAIIATHDVQLAELKKDFPANIINYHFDVQVSNDELYFDYKLKPGICTSLNASILMKKIGIEL